MTRLHSRRRFVLKGIVLVTVAGSLSRWWSNTAGSNSHTLSSFARACTSHFGSVAFGSLLTAILETIAFIFRSMASAAAKSGNCCVACHSNLSFCEYQTEMSS